MENIQNMQSGRTSPEHSAVTKVKISGEFSKKSQKPKFQCLQVESGQTAEWCELNTVNSLGECLMPNIGVSPSVAVESILSQILEDNAQQKYYLSPKACQGILRRAEKRNKELPLLLKAALKAQAQGNLLATNIDYTNFSNTTNNCNCLTPWDCQSKKVFDENGTAPCLQAMSNGGADFTAVFKAEILDMSHANDVIRECGEISPTLQARMGTGGNQIPLVFGICSQNSNSMKSSNPHSGIYEAKTTRTLDLNGGNPTCNQGGMLVVEPTYCIQGNTIERSDTAGANGKGVIEDISYTLNTVDKHAVAYAVGNGQADQTKFHDVTGALNCMHDQQSIIYAIDRASFNQGINAKYDFQIDDSEINSTIVSRGPSAVCHSIPIENMYVWIVRRLTPMECERLQGFPDEWTKYDTNNNEIKDTPRYKACGNSIAIPCAMKVFEGIVTAENNYT